MLLVGRKEFEEIASELLVDRDNPILRIRCAEGVELQVTWEEAYDRAAYQKVQGTIVDRIRPLGTRFEPYWCPECDQQILLVTKKTPKAWAVCDSCGERMQRGTKP